MKPAWELGAAPEAYTTAGWLYLATVIDCFKRKVIAYAMTGHMRTSLVGDALQIAARNHRLAVDCFFDSGQSTQYTSAEFGAELASLNVRRSLCRTGC